ncbi:MAG TPA: hypothetical protein VGL61_32535 [Kofleriaceae bacterium]|jgi:hypothetical protein
MIKLGMLRSILIASVCIGSACDVGSVLPQAAQTDGGGGGGGDGGGDAMGEAACPALNTNPGTGHHAANNSPGDAGATVISAHEGCLGQAGCHNETLGGVAAGDGWVYGGEAFKDAAGTIPYAGATIMLTVPGNTVAPATMTVADNGFFYLAGGENFPVPSATQSIAVAICVGTNKTSMATSLAAVQAGSGTDGNCNGALCHGPGQTGAYIYLLPQ